MGNKDEAEKAVANLAFLASLAGIYRSFPGRIFLRPLLADYNLLNGS
jgi:hypothetical protein